MNKKRDERKRRMLRLEWECLQEAMMPKDAGRPGGDACEELSKRREKDGCGARERRFSVSLKVKFRTKR